MFANINLQPYSVKNTEKRVVNVSINDENGNNMFPLLVVGKGTYISGATLQTSVDMIPEYGCHNFQLGNYCALAEDIRFMFNMNHNYRNVFQGEFEELQGAVPETTDTSVKSKGEIVVGNDVWIGHGATIMMGVTIHNGAVIGTNALVTKDVPPYAIVGGVPAKIIGYRFDEETIEKLQRIRWWEWPSEVISERKNDFFNTEKFAEKYDKVDALQEEKAAINRMTQGEAFLFYLDMNDFFPVYKKVIKQFADKYHDTDAELLLYLNPYENNLGELEEKLLNYLSEFEDVNCYVNIISDELVDDRILLNNVDYYISDKSDRTVCRTEYAYRVGVKKLSGVDGSIFN